MSTAADPLGQGSEMAQLPDDDLAVVWLDAHGDFNTPAITISGYLAGMPLAWPPSAPPPM
jgi:arginase family enzyme